MSMAFEPENVSRAEREALEQRYREAVNGPMRVLPEPMLTHLDPVDQMNVDQLRAGARLFYALYHNAELMKSPAWTMGGLRAYAAAVRAFIGDTGSTLDDPDRMPPSQDLRETKTQPHPLTELRTHLRDVHANEAAHILTNDEALQYHYDEHHGAGGVRNHAEPALLHLWQPRPQWNYPVRPCLDAADGKAHGPHTYMPSGFQRELGDGPGPWACQGWSVAQAETLPVTKRDPGGVTHGDTQTE